MKPIMKAADIPDELILNYLSERQGRWTSLYGQEFSTHIDGVWHKAAIFPEGTPDKVVWAKMRALHKRLLVGGCPCGCRGDFEITDKGLALIGKPRTAPYTGY